MDKRTEQIIKDFESNSLSPNDTFKFKCRSCGKCCINREDILLTARDLYNIARDLSRTIPEIVKRYCEVYIGSVSRIPIIKLRPVGTEKTCPLLRNKRCIVHNAKPVVCALFPLGRAVSMAYDDFDNISSDGIKPRYFLQSDVCGSEDHEQTVRGWLEQFGIPVEDEFYTLWTKTTVNLTDFFRWAEKNNVPKSVMNNIRDTVCVVLYLDYDTDMELIPQFKEKVGELTFKLLAIKSDISKQSGGLTYGE